MVNKYLNYIGRVWIYIFAVKVMSTGYSLVFVTHKLKW